jgi:hypothetical protein
MVPGDDGDLVAPSSQRGQQAGREHLYAADRGKIPIRPEQNARRSLAA